MEKAIEISIETNERIEEIMNEENINQIEEEITNAQGEETETECEGEETEMECEGEAIEMECEDEETEVEFEGEEVEEGNEIEDFDISELTSIKAKAFSKIFGEPGEITIVNSKDNGKRICIAKKSVDALGKPDCVQVGLVKDGIAIGQKLPNATEYFPLKKQGAKGIIYSAGLVEEITKTFNINFSNGRVSATFYNVVYKKLDDTKIAIFKLR